MKSPRMKRYSRWHRYAENSAIHRRSTASAKTIIAANAARGSIRRRPISFMRRGAWRLNGGHQQGASPSVASGRRRKRPPPAIIAVSEAPLGGRRGSASNAQGLSRTAEGSGIEQSPRRGDDACQNHGHRPNRRLGVWEEAAGRQA